MSKVFKGKLVKTAMVIFTLTLGFIAADILQHYMLLHYTTTWLHHTGNRQNSFDARLKIFPLGETCVEISNLVSTENKEVIKADKIQLRKSLFEWNGASLTAENVWSSLVQAKTLSTFVYRHVEEPQQVRLTFAPITVTDVSLQGPMGALTASQATAELVYTQFDHTVALHITTPNLLFNNKGGVHVSLQGHTTVHRPHNGEFTVTLKGITEFSQMLVDSGVLDVTKAQFLEMGAQLLEDQEGNINLKFRLKDNNIYFGPFALTRQF